MGFEGDSPADFTQQRPCGEALCLELRPQYDIGFPNISPLLMFDRVVDRAVYNCIYGRIRTLNLLRESLSFAISTFKTYLIIKN